MGKLVSVNVGMPRDVLVCSAAPASDLVLDL